MVLSHSCPRASGKKPSCPRASRKKPSCPRASGRNPAASAGDLRDLGLIPGSGRSTRGVNGNPFQHSCLENPTDRGAWQAAVHRVAKSWTWLKQLSVHAPLFLQCSLVLCDIFRREWVGGNLTHRDMSNGECQQIDSSYLNPIYKANGSSHPSVEPGATLETWC